MTSHSGGVPIFQFVEYGQASLVQRMCGRMVALGMDVICEVSKLEHQILAMPQSLQHLDTLLGKRSRRSNVSPLAGVPRKSGERPGNQRIILQLTPEGECIFVE